MHLDQHLLLFLEGGLRLLDLSQLFVLACRFLLEPSIFASDFLNFLLDGAKMFAHGLDLFLLQAGLYERFAGLVGALPLCQVVHVFVNLVDVVSVVALWLINALFFVRLAVMHLRLLFLFLFIILLLRPLGVMHVLEVIIILLIAVVIRGPVVLLLLVSVDEVHGLNDRALRLLRLSLSLALMADLSEVCHLADAVAIRSARAFLDLGFRADCPVVRKLGGTVLGRLVLVVDQVPLFLVGLVVLLLMMLGALAVVLVVIDPLLHTAGDAQCTL